MKRYYYHGSKKKISGNLLPRPSRVINNEKAVFATNTKWLSVIFIADFTDNDIDVGFINGKGYIMEKYPKAFNKLKTGGYIHYVNPENFKSDKRLGMKNKEFISKSKVKIEKVIKIKNVYNYIKRQKDVVIIDSNTLYKIIFRHISDK